MLADPGEPIKVGPASPLELIEEIESIIGDDLWDMRSDTGAPSPNLMRAAYAIIQFDGNECQCCGNQGGEVTFFGLDDKKTWSFEFSD
jgi:GH35 family endo-1,4-beta-xylanase